MSWQGPSKQGVIDNVSTAKRFTIVHAGSETGFVPNWSTKADYHHDMNASNFKKWLCEKLIPNLSANSVIVMDNASYHMVQINKIPNTSTRKADIQDWLRANHIMFEENQTRSELLVLVQKHKPEPIYEADEMLKEHGHEVLRLPPYHCDLNPIELIWSLGKRKVASRNISISFAQLQEQIKEAFQSITADDWKKNVDHVLHVEDQYRTRDGIAEDMEQFIISVRDEESSSSDESVMSVEYLESEFDYSE